MIGNRHGDGGVLRFVLLAPLIKSGFRKRKTKRVVKHIEISIMSIF